MIDVETVRRYLVNRLENRQRLRLALARTVQQGGKVPLDARVQALYFSNALFKRNLAEQFPGGMAGIVLGGCTLTAREALEEPGEEGVRVGNSVVYLDRIEHKPAAVTEISSNEPAESSD